MDNLGFTINETKSVLIPTQRLEFFGVIIDTVLLKVFLTEAKINKILSLCVQIISSKTITTRKLSSFIGLCVKIVHFLSDQQTFVFAFQFIIKE
jgi:hypothetical protein